MHPVYNKYNQQHHEGWGKRRDVRHMNLDGILFLRRREPGGGVKHVCKGLDECDTLRNGNAYLQWLTQKFWTKNI